MRYPTSHLSAFLCAAAAARAAYQGPVPAPTTGYGTPGPDAVLVESIPNAHWSGNPLFVFHPAGITGPVPTVFYAHGYGGNDTLYQIELLRHIASRGWAAVFVPYRTLLATLEDRYATLLDGFVDAARAFPRIVDTTRIGFFGHSFGAGATPYLADQLLVGKGWGNQGRFLYLSAPWYSLFLGDTVLAQFPPAPLLTVLYDDDSVNDHRMGMDVFRSISIPDSLKDLLLVRSATVSGYAYTADHGLPSQYSPVAGRYDAYDSRVTFRLLDALADFAFAGSTAGRKVSLGGGDSAQVSLGDGLPALEQTDAPIPTHPSANYEFPCDTLLNPRRAYCDLPTGDLLPSPRNPPRRLERSGSTLRWTGATRGFELRTTSGRRVARTEGPTLDLDGLRPGLYLVRTDAGEVQPFLLAWP